MYCEEDDDDDDDNDDDAIAVVDVTHLVLGSLPCVPLITR